MPNFTPIYAWPYQHLGEAPDGPNLGEDLALGIEATVRAIETRVGQHDATLGPLLPVYRDRILTTGVVGSVRFAGIPTDLRTVRIRYAARGDTAAQYVDINARINDDTGNNYGHTIHFFVNGTGTGGGTVGPGSSAQAGSCAAALAAANRRGGGVMEFLGWDTPSVGSLVIEGQAGAANAMHVNAAGNYFGAAASGYSIITLIPAVGNFVANSVFYLEGSYS